MARGPTRRPIRPQPRQPAGGPGPGAAPPTGSPRERIIAAFLALLAEKPIERIGLAEIAERAGVTLAEVRGEFDSTLAIYAAHVKEIDRQVLAGRDLEMQEESPRERLFDVLMRRLEILAPHKTAVRSLMRSARRDPPLALALNCIAVRSQRWMLAAADFDTSGLRGNLRAQGLACLWVQVIRVWLDDDDPGLARSMAKLDYELGRGQRWGQFLDDLCALVPPRWPGMRRWRARDYGEEPPPRGAAAV